MIASNEVISESLVEKNDNVVLKSFAHLFSVLFHPLFIPIYIVYFLAYIHPAAFVGFSEPNKLRTVVIVALNLFFFPLVSVLLLKAVGFIDSLLLKTQKDRIIPYIACGIFFFWTYTVFKEQSQYPSALTQYVFGLFLSSSAALLANIYFKISMHAIGLGGWLGVFIIMAYNNSMLMTWPLCLVLLITGVTVSSRLYLKSHNPFDIYTGLFIGVLTQIVAYHFV